MRRGLVRNNSGATALEFSILAPALLMMLYGVFDMGYALYCGSSVRSAVQTASRALIANSSTSASTLQSTAQGLLVNVPVNNLAITITQETQSSTETVQRVSWTYKYDLLIPFVPAQWLVFDSSLIVPMAPTN